MIITRILSITTVAAILVATVIGCGNETPTFDPAAQYSAESLAKELLLRAQKSASAPKKSGKAAPQVKEEPKVSIETATKEAGRHADIQSLDDVIADIVWKAGTIKTAPKGETVSKIVALISNENSLKPNEKQEITQKLEKAAAN